jgi:hypothetical protein
MTNFTRLTAEQINEALINAGYTDNNVESVKSIGRNVAGQFVYIVNNDPLYRVFVSIDHAGYIVAEF